MRPSTAAISPLSSSSSLSIPPAPPSIASGDTRSLTCVSYLLPTTLPSRGAPRDSPTAKSLATRVSGRLAPFPLPFPLPLVTLKCRRRYRAPTSGAVEAPPTGAAAVHRDDGDDGDATDHGDATAPASERARPARREDIARRAR